MKFKSLYICLPRGLLLLVSRLMFNHEVKLQLLTFD